MTAPTEERKKGVLAAVRAFNGISHYDLAKYMGVKGPSLYKLTAPLKHDGLIHEKDGLYTMPWAKECRAIIDSVFNIEIRERYAEVLDM